MDLRPFIRDIPDFPSPGIIFRDITPLLSDARAFGAALELMMAPFFGARIDKLAGIESRGFIFGSAMANRMGVGFIPLRKPGKLPYATDSESYSLEYGNSVLELHTDAITRGERVLLVDDLLATGGTLAAACRLLSRQGAELVGISLFCELQSLNGRALLPNLPVHTLMVF